MLGKAPLKFSLEHSLAPLSYWKSDTLNAMIESWSAFTGDISEARMQILVSYPILLTYMVVISM